VTDGIITHQHWREKGKENSCRRMGWSCLKNYLGVAPAPCGGVAPSGDVSQTVDERPITPPEKKHEIVREIIGLEDGQGPTKKVAGTGKRIQQTGPLPARKETGGAGAGAPTHSDSKRPPPTYFKWDRHCATPPDQLITPRSSNPVALLATPGRHLLISGAGHPNC